MGASATTTQPEKKSDQPRDPKSEQPKESDSRNKKSSKKTTGTALDHFLIKHIFPERPLWFVLNCFQMALMNAWTEELLFRGFILDAAYGMLVGGAPARPKSSDGGDYEWWRSNEPEHVYERLVETDYTASDGGSLTAQKLLWM